MMGCRPRAAARFSSQASTEIRPGAEYRQSQRQDTPEDVLADGRFEPFLQQDVRIRHDRHGVHCKCAECAEPPEQSQDEQRWEEQLPERPGNGGELRRQHGHPGIRWVNSSTVWSQAASLSQPDLMKTFATYSRAASRASGCSLSSSRPSAACHAASLSRNFMGFTSKASAMT